MFLSSCFIEEGCWCLNRFSVAGELARHLSCYALHMLDVCWPVFSRQDITWGRKLLKKSMPVIALARPRRTHGSIFLLVVLVYGLVSPSFSMGQAGSLPPSEDQQAQSPAEVVDTEFGEDEDIAGDVSEEVVRLSSQIEQIGVALDEQSVLVGMVGSAEVGSQPRLPLVLDRRELANRAGRAWWSDVDAVIQGSFPTWDATQVQGTNALVAGMELDGIGAERLNLSIDSRRVIPNFLFGAQSADVASLNALPFIATEAVEVLRGGMSGVHGNGAVGGVVNMVSRQDFRGFKFSYSPAFFLGSKRLRGVDANRFSALLGAGNDEFGIVLAIELESTPDIDSGEAEWLSRHLSATPWRLEQAPGLWTARLQPTEAIDVRFYELPSNFATQHGERYNASDSTISGIFEVEGTETTLPFHLSAIEQSIGTDSAYWLFDPVARGVGDPPEDINTSTDPCAESSRFASQTAEPRDGVTNRTPCHSFTVDKQNLVNQTNHSRFMGEARYRLPSGTLLRLGGRANLMRANSVQRALPYSILDPQQLGLSDIPVQHLYQFDPNDNFTQTVTTDDGQTVVTYTPATADYSPVGTWLPSSQSSRVLGTITDEQAANLLVADYKSRNTSTTHTDEQLMTAAMDAIVDAVANSLSLQARLSALTTNPTARLDALGSFLYDVNPSITNDAETHDYFLNATGVWQGLRFDAQVGWGQNRLRQHTPGLLFTALKNGLEGYGNDSCNESGDNGARAMDALRERFIIQKAYQTTVTIDSESREVIDYWAFLRAIAPDSAVVTRLTAEEANPTYAELSAAEKVNVFTAVNNIITGADETIPGKGLNTCGYLYAWNGANLAAQANAQRQSITATNSNLFADGVIDGIAWETDYGSAYWAARLRAQYDAFFLTSNASSNNCVRWEYGGTQPADNACPLPHGQYVGLGSVPGGNVHRGGIALQTELSVPLNTQLIARGAMGVELLGKGFAWAPQLDIRYQPFAQILISTGVGQSYRFPTPSEILGNYSSVRFLESTVETAQNRNAYDGGWVILDHLGNSGLKPEQTWTFEFNLDIREEIQGVYFEFENRFWLNHTPSLLMGEPVEAMVATWRQIDSLCTEEPCALRTALQSRLGRVAPATGQPTNSVSLIKQVDVQSVNGPRLTMSGLNSRFALRVLKSEAIGISWLAVDFNYLLIADIGTFQVDGQSLQGLSDLKGWNNRSWGLPFTPSWTLGVKLRHNWQDHQFQLSYNTVAPYRDRRDDSKSLQWHMLGFQYTIIMPGRNAKIRLNLDNLLNQKPQALQTFNGWDGITPNPGGINVGLSVEVGF